MKKSIIDIQLKELHSFNEAMELENEKIKKIEADFKKVESGWVEQKQQLKENYDDKHEKLEKDLKYNLEEQNKKLKTIKNNQRKEAKDKDKLILQKRKTSLEQLENGLSEINKMNQEISKEIDFSKKFVGQNQFNELLNNKHTPIPVGSGLADEVTSLHASLQERFHSIIKLTQNYAALSPPNTIGFFVVLWLIALVSGFMFIVSEIYFAVAIIVIVTIILHFSVHGLNEGLARSCVSFVKGYDRYIELMPKYQEFIEDDCHRELNDLGIELTKMKEDAEKEVKVEIEEIQRNYDSKTGNLDEKYNNEIYQLTNKIQENNKEFHELSIKISNEFLQNNTRFLDFQKKMFNQFPDWQKFAFEKQKTSYPNVEGVRIGEISQTIGDKDIKLPALVPFPFKEPIVYETGAKEKKALVKNVHSLLLRILISLPPSKARFIFIDPMGLGKNVGSFLNFLDYDESIIHHQAYYEPSGIDHLLRELVERMALITQKFLRNIYSSLEEYNQTAGDLAEPYFFLVFFDFPAGITREMMSNIQKILTNGHICGLYSIVMLNDNTKIPDHVDLSSLINGQLLISKNVATGNLQLSNYVGSKFIIDLPPIEMDQIIDHIGAQCKEARNVVVPFSKILELEKMDETNRWRSLPLDDLTIPIGVIGSTKCQYLTLGRGTSQHVLIAGKTGSGKSVLLHTIITMVAVKYSPQEVQLYLIDFKKGVEFKRYANLNLPHARVIAIESEREFGISVLEGIDAEMQRRGVLMRAAGVENYKEYRTKTNQELPRLLLIIDEYQEFFSVDSDIITIKVTQILDRLVRQGRAFGIHLILGSQTIAGSYNLSRSTIDQIAVRIALQCSEDDSRLILSSDNPAARMLSRPGEAIYNAKNGMSEGNFLFQIGWLGEPEQKAYLEQIHHLAQISMNIKTEKAIVFEGNDMAKIEGSETFKVLFKDLDKVGKKPVTRACIGEPISLKESTHIDFKIQSGSNLLVVGQDLEMANGIMYSAILSLALNYLGKPIRYFMLDLTPVEDSIENICNLTGKEIKLDMQYGRRGDVKKILNEVHQLLLDARQKEAHNISGQIPVFLFLHGIHRMKDFEANDFSSSPSLSFSLDLGETKTKKEESLGVMLSKILEEGPEYQIYTIAWCDNHKNLTRRFSRQVIKEFELKVLFRLNTDDSINMMDSVDAAKLKPNQAIYYNEDTGQTEKFKPFGLPDKNWLINKNNIH